MVRASSSSSTIILVVSSLTLIAASGGGGGGAGAAYAGVNVFSSGGSDAEVTASVNDFRTALGALNANNPESFVGGRREINWDGAPDTASSPNLFPADFFNANVAPRARGALFSTGGSGFQVSAKAGNPDNAALNFGNIDPSYTAQFRAFSAPRLFTAIGSNTTETRFFLPGTNTPAGVTSFGAIFTDVDNNGSTHIELFDAENRLLRSAGVPRSQASAGGFSFWGVQFTSGEVIARVVIVSGTNALGAGVVDNPAQGIDLVAMDDFIYGEPVSLPTPGAATLFSIAGAMLSRRRR